VVVVRSTASRARCTPSAAARSVCTTPVMLSPIRRVRSRYWISDDRSVACACASRPFAALLPSGMSNEIEAVTNGSQRPLRLRQ